MLLEGAESGARPLRGLVHGVLGEGSSVYQDTFQNCPRLSDKYLGECRSATAAPHTGHYR